MTSSFDVVGGGVGVDEDSAAAEGNGVDGGVNGGVGDRADGSGGEFGGKFGGKFGFEEVLSMTNIKDRKKQTI